MPTFPTYRGELPECLNPLNWRHYFLLLYWIYFNPTTFKFYLYQADPKLYHLKMKGNILRPWHVSAYRNPYIMMSLISVVLSILLGLPFALLVSWIESIPVNWLKWVLGMAGGVTAVGLFGVVFGMMISIAFNVAAGISLGLVIGLNSAIAGGVWSSATIGVWVTDIGWNTTVGLAFGILFGLVFGMAIGTTFGSAYNKKVGVAAGLIIGIIFGTAFVIGVSLAASVSTEVRFGVAFGVLGGISIGVLAGMEACIVGYILGCFVLGVEFGGTFAVMSGIVFNLLTGLTVFIGALRLVFYPFQFIIALCSKFWGIKHPLEWDEMIVLPLPYTRRILTHRLQQDEKEGLRFLANMGRNPFQRSVMQAVLYKYFHDSSRPLYSLYNFFTYPDFEEYVHVPVNTPDQNNLIIRIMLLRELALLFVKTTSGLKEPFFDRLAWWMGYPLRERDATPLTSFARMLCDLLDDKEVKAENFDLSSYARTYKDLSTYPGGEEIACTFDVMAKFVSYNNLKALSTVAEFTSNLTFDDPIRPTVLTVLQRLGDVGDEIAAYRDSTSRSNQQAALLKANDALKELDEYVQTEVMAPEQYLLRQIIEQWQDLIIKAGGEVGKIEITKPVDNPYVIANPAHGDLFVGREDIMQRLEELWVGGGQKPSVVLYGHRRMGKSSILDNLGARFGAQTIIVDFNMQREGMVESSGELLYNLALAMYDVLPTPDPSQEGNGHPPTPLKGGISLPEPEEEQFAKHNPYTAFNRFLKRLNQERGENRFIITVDEFELVEELIEKGIVEARLLDFWRSLIQTYPWFVMALAGLHTLQEMTEDYWHPLFASVIGIQVSFLRPAAAHKLITQPTPDFPIDYDQDAIDMIIALTNGQPYLVQLICHGLVTRFNRQRFEEGVERERRFSLEDVEAVINAPEFFRDGNAYFTGVWVQAEKSEPTGQTQVLRTLAESETGKSAEEIARGAGLTLEEVHAALETLVRHDVVKKEKDRWHFTVELMRRWVAKKKE